MQKIKYENCIELRVNLPEEVMNSWIPPLTLQMLMENALKHNMICEDMKLVIELNAEDRGYLVVKNNIIPLTELLKIGNNLIERPREIKSHNIGLNNIRSRYAFFTHRKIEVTKDQYFTVKLPIIEQDCE
jgi:sensor histidine kinase YesM